MDRTCEPASVARRIAEAIRRIFDDGRDRRVAARREWERQTLGLRDYERHEIMSLLAAELRGLPWGSSAS